MSPHTYSTLVCEESIMTKNFVTPIELQTVDGTAIAIDTWTAFDADGIEGNCFLISVNNDSDTDVFISYDGATRNEFVAAGERFNLNFQTNASPSGEVAKLKKWQKLWVQGTAAQAGNIYLSGYFN